MMDKDIILSRYIGDWVLHHIVVRCFFNLYDILSIYNVRLTCIHS